MSCVALPVYWIDEVFFTSTAPIPIWVPEFTIVAPAGIVIVSPDLPIIVVPLSKSGLIVFIFNSLIFSPRQLRCQFPLL